MPQLGVEASAGRALRRSQELISNELVFGEHLHHLSVILGQRGGGALTMATVWHERHKATKLNWKAA